MGMAQYLWTPAIHIPKNVLQELPGWDPEQLQYPWPMKKHDENHTRPLVNMGH